MKTIFGAASKARRHYLLSMVPILLVLPILLVVAVVWFQPALELVVISQKKNQTRDLVRATWSILNHLNQEVESGLLGVDEAKQQAKRLTQNLRYGPEMKDYFWIVSNKKEIISHPYLSSAENIPLNYRTQEGREVVPDIIELAETEGGGFLTYVWQTNHQKYHFSSKTSFFMLFEPWGWVIGSGFYEEEAVAEIELLTHQLFKWIVVLILLVVVVEVFFVRSIVRHFSMISTYANESIKLSQIIENCMLSVVIASKDNSVQYVNPYYLEVSGNKREDVIGKDISSLISDKTPSAMFDKIVRMTQEGKTWRGELILKDSQGRDQWGSLVAGPLFDESGAITHFYSIRRDITDQKKLIEEIIKAREEAEQSDRVKSAFLNTVSHEIRTPLNAIMGFVSNMEDENIGKTELKESLQIIKENALILENQFDRILQVSRMESSICEAQYGSWNTDSLIQEAIHACNKPGSYPISPEVKLEYVRNPKLRLSTVVTDREKFIRILVELLSNAIRYTQKGRIEVGCRIHEEQFELYVKDTGKGISDREKPQIFTIFHQGKDHFYSLHRGCGLGLHLVKRMVNSLHGEIGFTSTLGKGTEFYVRNIAKLNKG